MKKKIENKKMSKKAVLFLIGALVALVAIIVLALYLTKKPEYEEVSFYYENLIGDKYDVKAYLENDKVLKTEVEITFFGKDKKEQEKVAEYNYEIMKAQDKYEDLKLDKTKVTYKSFDDQSKNKTKEEIERSYTKSKIYKNFKWIED